MPVVENGKAELDAEMGAGFEADTYDAAGHSGEKTFERWLRDEAAAAYDAMKADPSRALSAKQVFDDIRALHFAKVATRA